MSGWFIDLQFKFEAAAAYATIYILRLVTYIYDHVTVNIDRPHINVYMQKMTVM